MKTADPIAWFRAFDDVTDIKCEVQRQLLNELAHAFHIMNNSVMGSLYKILQEVESLPEDSRNTVLRGIGIPSKALSETAARQLEIQKLRTEIERLAAASTQRRGRDRVERKAQIQGLQTRIRQMETENTRQLISATLSVNSSQPERLSSANRMNIAEALGLGNPFELP